MPDKLLEQEMSLQSAQRRDREEELSRFHRNLSEYPDGKPIQESLLEIARQMHFDVVRNSPRDLSLPAAMGPVLTERAPKRDKRIKYDGRFCRASIRARNTPRATSSPPP